MQYQLLGLGSGFFAHILATLMVCWRHMLRAAAAVAVVTALAVELLGLAVSHRFPPTLSTNLVAAALALALGYGVGATIFVGELVRGALRALSMLQAQLSGQNVVPEQRAQGGRNSPLLPTPLPIYAGSSSDPRAVARSARSRLGQPIYAPSAPQVATSLPLSDGSIRHIPAVPLEPIVNPLTSGVPYVPAYAQPGLTAGAVIGCEPFRAVERDATRPAVICEEDGASVMLLPDKSLYAAQFAAQFAAPRASAAVPALADPFVGLRSVNAPLERLERLERNDALPSQSLRSGLVGALPPLANAAPVSPPPDLYAPWSAVPPLAPIVPEPAISPTGRTELDPAVAGIAAASDSQHARGLIGRIAWPRPARRS